jgi:hypothetical protein
VHTGPYFPVRPSLDSGKRYEYRDRLTDVWMKVGSAWQAISSHYSVPVKE